MSPCSAEFSASTFSTHSPPPPLLALGGLWTQNSLGLAIADAGPRPPLPRSTYSTTMPQQQKSTAAKYEPRRCKTETDAKTNSTHCSYSSCMLSPLRTVCRPSAKVQSSDMLYNNSSPVSARSLPSCSDVAREAEPPTSKLAKWRAVQNV